jgi:tetratricopeptide (TPR) repeat protein
MFCACSSTSVYVPRLRPAIVNLAGLRNICIGHIQWGENCSGELAYPQLPNHIEAILTRAVQENAQGMVALQRNIYPALLQNGISLDALPNRATASVIYQNTGIRGWVHGTLLMAQYDESVTTAYIFQSNYEKAEKRVRMGLFRLRLLLTVYDLEQAVVVWSDTLESSASAESHEANRDPPPLDLAALQTEACAGIQRSFVSLMTPRTDQVLVTFLRDASYPEIVQGVRFAAAGRWRNADSLFRSLLRYSQGKPGEDALWYNLGLTQQYRNNFRAAQESFEHAIRIRDQSRYRLALENMLDMEREYEALTAQGHFKQ